MSRILLLGQALMPDVAALAQRCAEELGETLVFTSPVFDHGPDHPRLKRTDGPTYDNRSVRSRIRSWTAFMWAAFKYMRRIRGKPVVLLNSNPPMLALLGYLAARFRGQRYIVQVLDVYPDVMIQRGMLSARHPIARLWAAFNRLVFNRADAVVTLGEVMATRVRPYVTSGRQVLVIPTSVDASSIVPRPKTDNWFAAEHGLVDDLVVLYSGNYGASHDLSGLVDAMSAFDASSGVTFLYIGGGAREDELVEAAERHPGVSLHLPFQPVETLPFSMTSGDIAVVTLGAGTEGISMPSKCYYMMAAGCAILALSEGDNDLKRVVETHDCGITLSCSDSAGVVAAIQSLREDPETLTRYQRNARRAAEQVFDTAIVTAQHFELLKALVDDEPSA